LEKKFGFIVLGKKFRLQLYQTQIKATDGIQYLPPQSTTDTICRHQQDNEHTTRKRNRLTVKSHRGREWSIF